MARPKKARGVECLRTPREAIWTLLRAAHAEGRDMTQPEILGLVNEGRARPVLSAEVFGFLRQLQAAGAVRRDVKHKGIGRWRLTADKGAATPVMTEAGLRFGIPALEQRVFKAARVLKRFDLVEIARAAASEPGETRRYLDMLVAGGWLKTDGSSLRWRFIEANYSGPTAPILIAACHVLDPNSGATTPFGAAEQVTP